MECLVVAEERESRVDCHSEHIGNRFVSNFDLERFGVVSSPPAGRTRRINAWKKKKLDTDVPLTLAGLTAPLGHVEGESASVVASDPCLLCRREELADVIEKARVGREI